VIPLQLDKTGDGTHDGALRAEWKNGDGGRAELTLQFGPHSLRAEAAVGGAENAQAYSFPDPRGCSRIAFGKTAFAVVDHGLPAWSDEHASEAKAFPVGTKWRLGKDWATTLDTNVPLVLGASPLAAGSWHLTLARTAKGWNLVLSSAAADHRAKLDGFAAAYVKPVLEVPLTGTALPEAAKKLAITFVADGDKTSLAIAFGPERLAVPVALAKT
jgi:hypothetical protein